jgi:hypothetical protein
MNPCLPMPTDCVRYVNIASAAVKICGFKPVSGKNIFRGREVYIYLFICLFGSVLGIATGYGLDN